MAKRRVKCPTGKHRYRDQLSAMIALSQTELKGKRRGKGAGKNRYEQRAYHCPACAGWHLTSRR